MTPGKWIKTFFFSVCQAPQSSPLFWVLITIFQLLEFCRIDFKYLYIRALARTLQRVISISSGVVRLRPSGDRVAAGVASGEILPCSLPGTPSTAGPPRWCPRCPVEGPKNTCPGWRNSLPGVRRCRTTTSRRNRIFCGKISKYRKPIDRCVRACAHRGRRALLGLCDYFDPACSNGQMLGFQV